MKMLSLLLALTPLLLPSTQGYAQGDASTSSQTQAPAKLVEDAPARAPWKAMTLAQFLEALKAKRDSEAPAKIESFKLEAIFAAQEKGKVDVEAEILFRDPTYLRTTIKEGKKIIQRGLAGRRAWMSQNGESYALQGRAFAEDIRAVRRDVALARLTMQFLYPDRVLKGLVDPEGPIKATYEVYKKVGTRRKRVTVEVWEIRGKATRPKDYPLVLSPDHEGDVQITAYFDKVTLEPHRVYLKPLDKNGKPIPMRTEAIFFSDFIGQHGLRIPHRLGFFQPVQKAGVERLRKVSSLRIKRFLVPKEPLDKSLFKMPK